MEHNRDRKVQLGVLLALICVGGVVQAEYPIVGLLPDQRPHDAPVINQVVKDDAWYQEALTGIRKPYPHSLGFLEDQGNWYTPFNHPGMSGWYDIRGWHKGE